MKDLNYQLMKLCRDNRDGSYCTQANRSRLLDLMANQLAELRFRRMQAASLKPKHVDALVTLWKQQNISTGTMKNRLSALRWWAKKINKPGIINKDNHAYGIGKRTIVAEESKAQSLDAITLSKISDPYVRLSLQIQATFGLRREEAIKFQPDYAIKGDHIQLKASWTKGGRARTVPITNGRQWALLSEVRKLARGGSLIPPTLNYVEQMNRYDYQVRKARIKNPHGLRHAYAQRRYLELTGWKAPAASGPAAKSLTADQRALDKGARETISQELGHYREQISAVYVGQ